MSDTAAPKLYAFVGRSRTALAIATGLDPNSALLEALIRISWHLRQKQQRGYAVISRADAGRHFHIGDGTWSRFLRWATHHRWIQLVPVGDARTASNIFALGDAWDATDWAAVMAAADEVHSSSSTPMPKGTALLLEQLRQDSQLAPNGTSTDAQLAPNGASSTPELAPGGTSSPLQLAPNGTSSDAQLAPNGTSTCAKWHKLAAETPVPDSDSGSPRTQKELQERKNSKRENSKEGQTETETEFRLPSLAEQRAAMTAQIQDRDRAKKEAQRLEHLQHLEQEHREQQVQQVQQVQPLSEDDLIAIQEENLSHWLHHDLQPGLVVDMFHGHALVLGQTDSWDVQYEILEEISGGDGVKFKRSTCPETCVTSPDQIVAVIGPASELLLSPSPS